MPGFVFCSRWDFEPVLIFPQLLRLDKIDLMFLMVRLALRGIELEIHSGIESIPMESRSSIQEDSALNPRNRIPFPSREDTALRERRGESSKSRTQGQILYCASVSA
ncbi:MAG: hypothetical protein P0120_05950 [Nitrospira sp.]|nr:hypothetical protein [Nitrospira sp.]